MKTILITFTILFAAVVATAQVSITVNVPTAGGFSSAFRAAGGNAQTTTNLTVTGNIDARDVKFMRDSMPELAVLDMETVNIKAFSGVGGTSRTININYPENELPEGAFKSKQSLTSIKFPKSINSIGMFSFDNCKGLKGDLIIPLNVITIKGGAFTRSGFNGKLVLHNGIKNISQSFDLCGFTGDLIIPNSVTSIDMDAFAYCKYFTGDLIIPNSISVIGWRTFGECSGFSACFIPKSVNSIGTISFVGCSGLKKIAVDKNTPVSIDTSVFSGVSKTNCELIVPLGSKAAYQAATGWKDFTNIIEATFVTLNTQGGNPAAPITTTLTNSTIPTPPVPVKIGYYFAGWYKEAACTNAWNFATDVVSAPITLFAKWTSTPTAINTATIKGFQVYPNPATSNLNIANLPKQAEISIYNIEGKLIKQQKANAEESTIDVSGLPKGIYILKVISSQGSMNYKFIKQ